MYRELDEKIDFLRDVARLKTGQFTGAPRGVDGAVRAYN
jgi:hypothetical protein